MDEFDRQDWQAFRQGNRRAFDRLYARHRDRLFSYCLYTSGDRELSQDVVQESFVKLLGQTDTDFHTGLDNWLFVCVRNTLFNHLKRRRTRQTYRADQLLPDQTGANPAEARLLLQQVMARLQAEDRDLILMREFLGLSIGEIAKASGLSEGAVRVKLHRIRKRMIELKSEDQ